MCDFLIGDETQSEVYEPDTSEYDIWDHPLWENYDAVAKLFAPAVKKALKKMGLSKTKEEIQDLVDGAAEHFLKDIVRDNEVQEDDDDDISEIESEQELPELVSSDDEISD